MTTILDFFRWGLTVGNWRRAGFYIALTMWLVSAGSVVLAVWAAVTGEWFYTLLFTMNAITFLFNGMTVNATTRKAVR